MKNNGSCGPCGDDAGLPRPRPHENRGIFSDTGYRTIFRQFTIAEVRLLIPSDVINANFTFDLCNLGNNANANETESCFAKLDFVVAPFKLSAVIGPQNTRGLLRFYVKMPFRRMQRAVLRTTAVTGNEKYTINKHHIR